MRTQEEVEAEVNALKEIKPKVRQYSMFGDDNHAKIDAQIRVLVLDMDENEIWEYWDEDNEYDTLRNAEDARDWLDGKRLDSLVNDWLSLVEK